MPGRSLERLSQRALIKRVEEAEEETRRLREWLSAIEAELEELAPRLARLTVMLHDLKLRLEGGRE